MSDLSGLVDATASARALTTYLNGGEFKNTLHVVGDVHFMAAAEALSGSGTRELHADVREARTHLRAAHVAYAQIYDIPFRPLVYIVTLGTREIPMLIAGFKDHIACCLIAVTYAYFGEFQDAETYLKKAERARKLVSYHTLYTFANRWNLRTGNPFGIPKLSAYLHPRSLQECGDLIDTVGGFDFAKFSAGLRRLRQA